MQIRAAALLCTAWLSWACAAGEPRASLTGTWDANVDYGAVQVPFRFGIEQSSTGVSGW